MSLEPRATKVRAKVELRQLIIPLYILQAKLFASANQNVHWSATALTIDVVGNIVVVVAVVASVVVVAVVAVVVAVVVLAMVVVVVAVVARVFVVSVVATVVVTSRGQ